MPSLATTNRFQQIDQKSIQTFMALSDLTVGHIRGYHGSKPMSILNVVILVRCPRINWTGFDAFCGADPLVRGRRPRRPAVSCRRLTPRLQQRDEGVPRGPGGPPHQATRYCPVNSWTPH